MTEQYLELVTKEGGSVENTDIWGRRKLAYEIDGKTEGNYVVVNYTTTPEVSADRQVITRTQPHEDKGKSPRAA